MRIHRQAGRTKPANSSRSGRRRRLGAIAAVAAVTVLLSACSSDSDSSEGGELSDVTITIGIQGQPGVFEASGAWDSAPYKVEFAPFSLPTENFAANAAGDVDISDLPVWSGVQGLGALGPNDKVPYQSATVFLAPHPDKFDPTGFLIASRQSGIKTLDDIKNHTGAKLKFGYTKKSLQEIYAAKALDYLGLGFDDIESVDLQYAQLLVALDAGEIDVLFLPYSTSYKQIKNGAVPVAPISTFGYVSRWSLWVNSEAIENPTRKAAIDDALARYVDYLTWQVENPDAVAKAFVEGSNFAPEAAQRQWEDSRYSVSLVTPELVSLTQQDVEFAVKVGVLPGSFPVDRFFTHAFDDAITKALEKSGYPQKLEASYE